MPKLDAGGLTNVAAAIVFVFAWAGQILYGEYPTRRS